MANHYVNMGEHTIKSVSEYFDDIIWTDGLGDCMAFACLGRINNKNFVFFAHFTSIQYLAGFQGGKADGETRALVKFIKDANKDIQVLAATNWNHRVQVVPSMKLKFSGLPTFDLKNLKKGGNDGIASLKIGDWTMHSCKPALCDVSNDISLLSSTGGAIVRNANKNRDRCVLL